jgi:hypothetical protein
VFTNGVSSALDSTPFGDSVEAVLDDQGLAADAARRDPFKLTLSTSAVTFSQVVPGGTDRDFVHDTGLSQRQVSL